MVTRVVDKNTIESNSLTDIATILIFLIVKVRKDSIVILLLVNAIHCLHLLWVIERGRRVLSFFGRGWGDSGVYGI